MMIPYDRIISEMERQLAIARGANDEQSVREAISAVRSLCEVALGGEKKREEKKILPKMLSTGNNVMPTSLESKPLIEEDANGGSIFDF